MSQKIAPVTEIGGTNAQTMRSARSRPLRASWKRWNSTRSSFVMCVFISIKCGGDAFHRVPTLFKPTDAVERVPAESGLRFLPIRRDITPAHAVAAEVLVVVEVKFPVHFDGLCDAGADELVSGVAAATQGVVCCRRVNHAD